MAPSTYGKTWWRGGYACGCMIQSIEDIIEPRLRKAGYLGQSEQVSVYQYCYSGSVEASAGTHDGGGALDHRKGSDGETKIWRECGVADWQRGTPEDTYFDDHNHGIWQGCPHLSSGAEDQIDQYKAGCNGLSGWGPDQSPYVKPITWQDAYDKYIGDSEPEGILGMSELNRTVRNEDRVIKPSDDWTLVLIDDDDNSTFFTGGKDGNNYIAHANVQIEGLAPGGDQPAQFRFGRYDPDAGKVDTYHDITEVFGSTGDSYGQINEVEWLPEGLKLRLYVKCPVQIKILRVKTAVMF